MPIYEMEPEHILSADVNAIQQPEPVYGDNEKLSWYAPLNPLDDSNETKRLRDAALITLSAA